MLLFRLSLVLEVMSQCVIISFISSSESDESMCYYFVYFGSESDESMCYYFVYL